MDRDQECKVSRIALFLRFDLSGSLFFLKSSVLLMTGTNTGFDVVLFFLDFRFTIIDFQKVRFVFLFGSTAWFVWQ